MKARFFASFRVAGVHLLCGILLMALFALWIFLVWFPYPYYKISNGAILFLILMAVDVVTGPVLTFVLYSPEKSRFKWGVDMALIASIQLSALVYGVGSIASSRPIYLAFEGNRFRVVTVADVPKDQLGAAPQEYSRIGIGGPQLLGVRLLNPGDEGFIESMVQALNGNHPAFRPERWVSYASQKNDVRKALRPLSDLSRESDITERLERIKKTTGLDESELGFLPLVQDAKTDWVVVVGRKDALPVAYWNVDGWGGHG